MVFHIVKHIFRAGICCLQVELHILKPHIVGMADVKPVSRERRAEHIGLRVCINQFRHIGIGIIDGPSSRQCDFNILYQHIIDDSIRHAHNGTGQFAYTGGLHIGNNHILQFAHLRRTFTFPQAEEDGRMHIFHLYVRDVHFIQYASVDRLQGNPGNDRRPFHVDAAECKLAVLIMLEEIFLALFLYHAEPDVQ